MARICIVTPSALGSNPRVVKEAEALAAAGHTVHVIAVRVLDLVDARDADILAGVTWSCERLDLRSRLRWRLLRLRQMAAGKLGGKTDAYSPLTAPLARRAAAWPADLYIGHYVAGLPAVAKAAAKSGALYAFDAEDFHPGDPPPGPEHDAERATITAIERRDLPGCAYVTAASPGIAQAYVDTYGMAPPTLILNVFPKSQAPAARQPRASATPGPSIYWFSQTLGPDRGLESAVEALSRSAARPHLYLRGDPSPGYADALKAHAAAHGVGDQLHLLEPGPPSQMAELAAGYDLGLVAENGRTRNHQIALSNKQFTYLLAGVPVLMSDTPGHTAFAALAPGAAFLFNTEDAADLARALDELLLDPSGLSAAREQAFALGQERFNWDLESQAFVACVEAALAARRP
jgi:glycosyltransferase involved in cell wall biosynthesis